MRSLLHVLLARLDYSRASAHSILDWRAPLFFFSVYVALTLRASLPLYLGCYAVRRGGDESNLRQQPTKTKKNEMLRSKLLACQRQQ